MCDSNHIMKILGLLNEDQLTRFQEKTFRKDDVLYREDEECEEVSFLKEGEIRISSYTLGGNEVVYNVIKSGGMFGNNLAFSSIKEYRGNVIASTDGVFYSIKTDELVTLFQENREFLKEYLHYEADMIKEMNAKMKILSFPLAEERLDYAFELGEGKIQFKNVSELAKSLFLSRESCSRLIHQWQKDGKLEIKKGVLIRIGS